MDVRPALVRSWINHVQQRKRKPIARATVESWQGCLDVWFYRTSAMFPWQRWGISLSRNSWKKWSRQASRPRGENSYSQVVKSVVASAVNEEGEQLFPRKWNHEFVDTPVVDKSKQNTPHFTSEVIAGILKTSKGYKQMFCALLGGTGLRAGEAIGLEIDKHISGDFRTLYIRQKVRRTKLELFLKTDAGLVMLISALRSQNCSRPTSETALPVFSFTIGSGIFCRRQMS
jgi:hypothetical protein